MREDERRRLRRDLHDGLGPALAAIGLKAGLAAREVPPESAARGLLGEIDTEVKASLADIRRLVEGLRPPALDELGLVGAVRSRAAALAGELRSTSSGSEPPGPLPAAIETAAYRIVVEAMTNAVRHSGGTHCTVSILVGEDAVELSVRDDGTWSGSRIVRPAWGCDRCASAPPRWVEASRYGRRTKVGTVVAATLPLELGAAD